MAGNIETKQDGRMVFGDGSSSRFDAALGWDGVSMETVVSTVIVSIDAELAESMTSVAASPWNSLTTDGGDLDDGTVSVVGTSKPVIVCRISSSARVTLILLLLLLLLLLLPLLLLPDLQVPVLHHLLCRW